MDKKKIETMCSQIVQAVNSVQVSGEQNMMQLLGIGRNARAILIELGAPDKEEDDGGQESK